MTEPCTIMDFVHGWRVRYLDDRIALADIEPMTHTAVISELFFFSSRRRHTRLQGDWSSDVCSSDLHLWKPKLVYRVSRRYPRILRYKTLVCGSGRRIFPGRCRPSRGRLRDRSHCKIGRASCRERV